MQAEVQELVRMKKSIFDELDSVTEMQNQRNIKIFHETNLSYYNSAMHNNNKVIFLFK